MILPAAGLGQVVGEDDRLGPAERADLGGHVVAQLLAALRRSGSASAFRVTKAMMAWPVVGVVGADDGRLGHRRVVDQRRLDLGGRDAVARDVHDVVDPAEQPEVAVVVELGAVAGEVPALEPAPVRLLVALRVAVDAAQHRRPRAGEREVAAADRRPAGRSSSTTSAAMPGSGKVAEPGLSVVAPGRGEIMIAPVSVCHHVSTTGQRPPPMCCQYQIHASGLIGSPTVPSTRSYDRSWASGYWVPHFMNVRMAVGRGVEDA